MSERPLMKVEYSGPLKFADGLKCEAVVLADGTRGFVRSQLLQAIGIKGNIPVPHFCRFLAEIAPKSLESLEKSGSTDIKVIMPHGGHANFIPSSIIPDICDGVIDAALAGTLHAKRRHLVPACRKIQSALSRVGIDALIDEATGYQYHRAPDALQDLFARLIRKDARAWDRRFPDEYYRAILKLWGKEYTGNAGGLPSVVGQITRKWVYEQILPSELLAHVDSERGWEKIHQRLSEEGLALLGKQTTALTVVAQSSYSYQDFDSRCHIMFFGGPQQTGLRFM